MIDSGMLCPKCKRATTIYNSRPKENGTTKRYRECLHCGFRFKTIETYNFQNIKNGIKLKAEDPRKKEMQSLHESGMSYEKIGEKFGVSRQRIHQIIRSS
jgi:transcriptional regulator NrdR family protein